MRFNLFLINDNILPFFGKKVKTKNKQLNQLVFW